MQPVIPISKNEENEGLVPTEWRPSLVRIANAIVAGQVPKGEGIQPLSAETFEHMQANIAAYAEPIGSLHETSWETSVCMWMQSYWDVLVDLSSANGEPSDLVLQVRIYHKADGYVFHPHLVYVP